MLIYVIYKFHSGSQETHCISMTHTVEMGNFEIKARI